MKQSHKTLLLWVLLILMFVVIYQLVTQDESPRQVPFSDFITDVRGGHVESITAKPRDGATDFTFVYVDENERRDERETIGPPLSPELMEDFREHSVRTDIHPADDNSWTGILVTWVPMIFLLVIFFFFMRQLQASGGKAMSFGKSRARLLNESQNKVTFADVAGVDEAKDDCEEIIAFLKDPKKFQRLGGRIPKGVLLMGPPGTGKTLLAKACAREAEANFISMRSSDLLSKWYGESEKQVARLFQRARQVAPTVIFLDEIDSLAPRRGGGLGEPAVTERVVNTILAEMDGLEELKGVVLVGATNQPTLIDPALLRPGRFDELIYVPVPNERGRLKILKIHTQGMPLAAGVDLASLAKRTEGYTGADLEDLVRRAGLIALRHDLEVSDVPMPIFEEALKHTRASVTEEMDAAYRKMAEDLQRERPAEAKRIGF